MASALIAEPSSSPFLVLVVFFNYKEICMCCKNKKFQSRSWWFMPITPVFERLKRGDCHEFEPSLDFIMNSM